MYIILDTRINQIAKQGLKDVFDIRLECLFHVSLSPAICSVGEQYNSTSGLCDPCPIGYYFSDVTDPNIRFYDVFFPCHLCPPNFITNSTGASRVEDCNIGRLTITVKNCMWPDLKDYNEQYLVFRYFV